MTLGRHLCRCGCGEPCRGEYARGHNPRPDPTQAAILDVLAPGTKWSRGAIAQQLGRKSTSLGSALSRLKKRGVITTTTAQWERVWEVWQGTTLVCSRWMGLTEGGARAKVENEARYGHRMEARVAS